jgi:beta-glucanase (GH16 family)
VMVKFRGHPLTRLPIMLLLAFVTVAAPSMSATVSNRPKLIDLAQYEISFADEFDQLDVSPWGPKSKWIAHTPWHGDFGDAAFLDPGAHSPFSVKDGILTITMRRNDRGAWGSGLLASSNRDRTGFTQSGGYFEARMKLPSGMGVWPAFWLAGADTSAKVSPEIDVMEYYGQFPDGYVVTVHNWQDHIDIAHSEFHVRVPANTLSERFHTYGAEINGEAVTFYLDRTEIWTIPSSPVFMEPLTILVNLAAGGGWPIDHMPNPSELEVDYIRAYKAK